MKKLLTICLVLLLCASAYATPVGRSNLSASIADVQTDTTALIQLAADQLAQINNAGNVFYVDSGATGSGTGTSWTNAAITIKLGATKCAADNGDVLAVFPSHVETLTVADQVDITKAGLIVFGCGIGESRPTLTYTTNGEFVIGADDVEIHNINFIAGNAVTHAIDVEAGFENYVINNCRFTVAVADTDEFVDCIDVAAGSDNGRITNNRFEMGAASAVSAISHIGSDYTEISGNIISGDYSTACIEDATTASIWMFIQRNTLINGTVGGTAGLNAVACVSLKSDTAAVITDNKLFCNVASSDLAIVAADGFLSGNTYNETEASSTGSIDGLVVGQTYVATKAALNTATTDDLFLVTGYIQITNFFGEVTTVFAGSPGNMTIELDSADDDYDSDFSTTVTVDTAGEGDWIKFTNVIDESVLSFTVNTSSMPAINWLCSPGMIEQTLTSTGTGATTWYMTYIPLTPDATVTAQ